MRINFDLLREILIDIAEHDGSYDLCCCNLVYGDSPRNVINYHVRLLVLDGYIKAIDTSDKTGYDYACLELTLQGQSFLDKIEANTKWAKIKQYLSDNAINITFGAIELAFKAVSHG